MNKQPISTRFFIGPGSVVSIEKTDASAILTLDRGEKFRVDPIWEDVVRLKLSRGGTFDESPTFACADASFPTPPAWHLEDFADRVEISTAAMTVVARKSPFGLAAWRADGSVIFTGATAPDGAESLVSLNDEFVVTRRCGAHDAFFGLGEKTGPLNRRGRSYVQYNIDIFTEDALTCHRLEHDVWVADARDPEFDPYYVNIPFFYHLDAASPGAPAAGFFIDNGAKAYFEFQHRDHYRYRFCGGQYTEYLFAGPSMAAILDRYTRLTGRMAAPPLWSLGMHQCRWHDYTQSQILEIGDEYRQRGIPCDALWLDIDYMDGFRVFTWDSKKFRMPPACSNRCAGPGFAASPLSTLVSRKNLATPFLTKVSGRISSAKLKMVDSISVKYGPGARSFRIL
jgi:alpha-glucosidase